MADAKDKVETSAPAPTPETKGPKHVGHGRYEYQGRTFKDKVSAEAYERTYLTTQAFEDEHGDRLPEGYDLTVHDRVYEYRGSLMELAMNERYTPIGDFNPYYDREWYYAWAAYNGTDISDKRSKGYQLMSIEALEKGVSEDRFPPHLQSMVRAEGTYLVYGDNVLMRMPRVIRRQQQEAKRARVLSRMKALDDAQRGFFDNAGVGIKESPVKNELEIRL